jgi:hypothetical protein
MHQTGTNTDLILRNFDDKNLSRPASMRTSHIEAVLDGSRKLLKRTEILPVANTTSAGLYPDSSALIQAAQNIAAFAPYLPPGPHYNEHERRWSLNVINSVAR